MKYKNLITIFIFVVAVFLVGSCNKIIDVLDKDSEYTSDTSVYPIFVLEGSEVMTHQIGGAWTEPGYHCSEISKGGDDLTSSVVVDDSELDVAVAGLYSISYTAENKFGYSKTIYRSVLVTDGVDDLYDISGSYFTGFFPYDDGRNVMTVSPAETKGFWIVTNVNNLANPVSTMIADLGDKNYLIVKSFYKRKVDLRVLMCEGSGYYTEVETGNDLLKFTPEIYYELTGVIAINPPVEVTWKKIEN